MRYSGGAEPLKTKLKIEVDLHNSGAVFDETLARAKQQTTRIVERTGVATIWLDYVSRIASSAHYFL